MAEFKYDVFISYSRKDTKIADIICEAFDKAGITYFFFLLVAFGFSMSNSPVIPEPTPLSIIKS